MSAKMIRIYVDTNVLINYCTGQPNDIDTLNYIFTKRRKEVLFTSSLAVVQTISRLQTKGTKGREAYSREETIKKLYRILPKFTILDLSFADVEAGFTQLNRDIEDNVHYVLSQKAKCDAILTNNRKDFVYFNRIAIVDTDLSLLKPRLQ